MFVPPAFHLSIDAEKSEYDKHENAPDDVGYRCFLGRMFEPVCARLERASSGLDFGSGPGPTLSVMFEEAGHSMSIYDPFYSPDTAPLSREYDFVTCTEVVEHFRSPDDDLRRLWACVRPGGLLGIMTKLVSSQSAFAAWHYRNDPTHISFFSRSTFEWLAERWTTEVTFVGSDVVLFNKPDTTVSH